MDHVPPSKSCTRHKWSSRMPSRIVDRCGKPKADVRSPSTAGQTLLIRKLGHGPANDNPNPPGNLDADPSRIPQRGTRRWTTKIRLRSGRSHRRSPLRRWRPLRRRDRFMCLPSMDPLVSTAEGANPSLDRLDDAIRQPGLLAPGAPTDRTVQAEPGEQDVSAAWRFGAHSSKSVRRHNNPTPTNPKPSIRRKHIRFHEAEYSTFCANHVRTRITSKHLTNYPKITYATFPLRRSNDNSAC